MNELLLAMSSDMGIGRFYEETEDAFIYRLFYSALGLWCLYTAQNSLDGISGTTKQNQSIVLNELITRFSELYPSISDRFIDNNNQQVNFTVHIRRVYEETGYLLTDNNNRNLIANYGRSVPIGNKALYFGIPNKAFTVNGLGIFSCSTIYEVSTKEFLIRDDLTYEEFFRARFDPIDFCERDIDPNDLEFFSPQLNIVPSQSWGKRMETNCTVARKSKNGPFYRVMLISDKLQFADEPMAQQNSTFASYDYRCLFFALKAHYKNPLKAIITKQDETYSKIRLGGHLPNREYYFLLLMSWPVNNAFDKSNFIIRNDLLPEVISTLVNIGIEINGGYTNA